MTAPGACNWSVANDLDWIIITSALSGSGNSTVTYEVRENFTGSPRMGTFSIAGRTLTVIQDSDIAGDCTYAISPTSGTISSGGGSGQITVTAGANCAWQAVSNVNWITITSGGIGMATAL